MTQSLEDRLRAHFADLAGREPPLPEPDPGPIMAGELPRLPDREPGRFVSLPPRSRRLVMAAGMVAAAALVVAALVVGGAPRHDGRVDVGRTSTVPPAGSTPTSVPGVRGTTRLVQPPRPGPTPSTPHTPPAHSASALTVADGSVLGFWDGRAWHDAPAGTAMPVTGGELYQYVRPGSPITRSVGGSPTPTCEPGLRQLGIPFPQATGRLGVAVTGVADPRPRPVVVANPATSGYETPARAVLAALGVPDALPVIVQALRADLDGDGRDEAVVVAQRAADQSETAHPDDYSVVFLRALVGGKVTTTILAHSVGGAGAAGSTPTAETYSVEAVADLNGDGRMEIVIGNHGYEWTGATGYELHPGGAVVEVLHTACGV